MQRMLDKDLTRFVQSFSHQLVSSSASTVVTIGSSSNNDGDGYENVTLKLNRVASDFIALIPSRLIREMLANAFVVEF